MICRKIALSHFRNIDGAEVHFSEGVNVLHGDNAQGKTNLIEAIYYAAIGKSFRATRTADIVSFGREAASFSLDYQGQGREQNITVRLFRSRMRAVEKNRVRIAKMSELVGSFRAVLFCPEHLALIKYGPAERRQFLDIAISSLDPLYLSALQRYGQILKQRNALLKTAERDRTVFDRTVDIWSRQLAHEAAYIARARACYIEKAAEFVADCFHEMTGERETPRLLYLGCSKKEEPDYLDLAATEEELYGRLCTAHEREIASGATLWGVHKDDMEVELNGHGAREFCSQGQQRSLALALKMAEGEISREDCGEYPVFLFDDVLSELDRARRDFLLHHIHGKQVILTTCETDARLAERRIYVSHGAYVEE